MNVKSRIRKMAIVLAVAAGGAAYAEIGVDWERATGAFQN